MMTSSKTRAPLKRAPIVAAGPPVTPMERSAAVVCLAVLIGVLAVASAVAGLLWPGGGDPYSVTTYRGQVVEIYGRGLYRYDSLFAGAANKGSDILTLGLGIPALLLTTWHYRRGSLRGGLLLLGVLTYFGYLGASYALNVAYNALFLAYVALFAASLWALALAFRSFDVSVLGSRLSPRVPRRSLAVFLFASGVLTLFVWLIDPLTSLIQGDAPKSLRVSTTLFTNALDMAVIVPALIIAGVLIMRREPLGYLIAFPLLVLEISLAPMISLQTVLQVRAGVEFTPGEMVGPIAGFVVFALSALLITIALLRDVAESGRASSTAAEDPGHV